MVKKSQFQIRRINDNKCGIFIHAIYTEIDKFYYKIDKYRTFKYKKY